MNYQVVLYKIVSLCIY